MKIYCRKFPSLIGNIFEQSLAEIYDSDSARRYRAGTQACRSCPIRPVCGEWCVSPSFMGRVLVYLRNGTRTVL
ncbi:MAG: SPASM domain-containing protein [Deltaproteobacteria bacterium]|nr:SPASM domain-containing protein [Deltaproteobacteria bacterium]